MEAGTRRYAVYCKARGMIGTPFVMRAERFYGREEWWAEEWALPHAFQPRPGPPKYERESESAPPGTLTGLLQQSLASRRGKEKRE